MSAPATVTHHATADIRWPDRDARYSDGGDDGSDVPTDDERAEGRRHAALHHAVQVCGVTGDARTVMITAREFLKFLDGE